MHFHERKIYLLILNGIQRRGEKQKEHIDHVRFNKRVQYAFAVLIAVNIWLRS